MLQIIDFYAKRDYALAEQYKEEHADEIAKQKENEERQKAAIIESGGITEEEAVEIAQEWLVKIFGITGDGMEMKYYFNGDIPIAGKTGYYQVNWTYFPTHQNYYICIFAKDGSLARASHGSIDMARHTFAVTEASVLLSDIKQSAVSFVKESLQQTYEDAYYVYYIVDNTLCAEVNFIFVREDNSAFTITYYWNGVFTRFQENQFSNYQEKYEDIKASVEEVEYIKHNGEEAEIDLFFEKIENVE